jgi:dienelactone hydrolase
LRNVLGDRTDRGLPRIVRSVARLQGKNYEFHRYDNAGHGFFYYDRPMYRIEQALDGWKKVFAFLQKHLAA